MSWMGGVEVVLVGGHGRLVEGVEWTKGDQTRSFGMLSDEARGHGRWVRSGLEVLDAAQSS